MKNKYMALGSHFAERKAAPPYTIQRLLALRAGQEIVYYRGNLDADIASCAPYGVDKKGAPCARALLHGVRNTAQQLAAQGRIALRAVHFPSTSRRIPPCTRYYAKGL